MKHNRFFLLLATAALMAVFQASAFADQTAQDIVTEFNAMNGGYGYQFNPGTAASYTYSSTGTGEIRLFQVAGTQMADVSAYTSNTAGTNYFQTFCVEPSRQFGSGGTSGFLDYANNTTSTFMNGDTGLSTTLTLGAAYLYKQFATGNLNYDYVGSNRAYDAAVLQDAIWYLIGNSAEMKVTTSTNNKYLQMLDGMSGYTWSAAYDPGQSYMGLMDDYRVFVMQTPLSITVNPSGGMGIMSMPFYTQDVLYVAKPDSSDTPEPASILLWTLGGLGAAGMAYRKRRNSTK